jgi:dTDP-4-dehydrorhamnose 3,5-epimerase
MKIIQTNLKGVIVLCYKGYNDNRGNFSEIFNKLALSNIGIEFDIKQINHAYSKLEGTFRGFHLQSEPNSQAKLVYCNKGRVLDIVIDIDKDSKTYLSSFAYVISEGDNSAVFIPKGYAHGYLTLENDTEITYLVDNYYSFSSEKTIRYDDPKLGIILPKTSNFIISEKDSNGILVEDLL